MCEAKAFRDKSLASTDSSIVNFSFVDEVYDFYFNVANLYVVNNYIKNVVRLSVDRANVGILKSKSPAISLVYQTGYYCRDILNN